MKQDNKKPIRDIQKIIDGTPSKNLKLYFITRNIKPDFKPSQKALQKYSFSLYKVDIDNDIQEMFLESVKNQFETAQNDEEMNVIEYEAVDDDTKKLYTYDLSNKTLSFADIIQNQLMLGTKIKPIGDIDQFFREEKVWAFCVELQNNSKDRVITLTKLGKSKIGISETSNPETNIVKKKMLTIFNSTSGKLELLRSETVAFDKKVDCAFNFENNNFLIFHKTNFENVIGIEEEFRDVAIEVKTIMEESGVIEGLESIDEEMDSDAALHKRMFKLKKALEGQTIDLARIAKMKKTWKEFSNDKIQLQFENGKVIIRNKQEFDEVIRLLEDYYLKSDQTGYKYGAPVKMRI